MQIPNTTFALAIHLTLSLAAGLYAQMPPAVAPPPGVSSASASEGESLGFSLFGTTRKRAEAGDAQAQFDLGCLYDSGDGVNMDRQQAATWYRKAAEQGHAKAQYEIGLLYYSGEGVAKSPEQAVAWFRKAAVQGHANAQSNLGLMYASGSGVPKDARQAVEWYLKAAAQGSAGGQHNLASMYSNGEGVPQDAGQAAAWYLKAAEQGYAPAQFNLGNRYARGQGVSMDALQAVGWWRKAAERGLAEAQCNLGVSYSAGTGVPKDNVQAYKWFSLAASGGNATGVKGREQVAALMTREQITEAQRLAASAALPKTKVEGSVFGPAFSDFVVTFSREPKVEEVEVTAPGGERFKTIQAEFRGKDSFQRAEFSPMDAAAGAAMTKEDSIARMRAFAEYNGIQVPEFRWEVSGPWKVVRLRGTKILDDAGTPTPCTFECVTYYGHSSALCLFVGAVAKDYPPSRVVKFLGSVQKNPNRQEGTP